MTPVEVLRFHDAPDLRRVFAQALLNGRRGGDTVPEVVAERRGVVLEPSLIVDYAHTCGFTVGSTVPVTYPHVLGFPLQAAVMGQSDFPLPLLGLVHVQNRITWTSPFGYSDAVDVRVRATRLRSHRRGRVVDLVTEVSRTRDPRDAQDPPDWTGVSTYLHRGAGDDTAPADAVPDVASLRALPGGPTWRFGEGDGRRYAAVSGDVNPIHLHALSAKAFGFPRAIAHGMYTYARLLGSLGARVPDSGSSTVWFRKPVLLPSTTLLRVDRDVDGALLAALLPAKGDGEHLVATVGPAGEGVRAT